MSGNKLIYITFFHDFRNLKSKNWNMQLYFLFLYHALVIGTFRVKYCGQEILGPIVEVYVNLLNKF